MAENVVDFPQPEEAVWRCNCGCWTHYVHESFVECAMCGATAPLGGWTLPKDPNHAPEATHSVRDFGDTEFAMRRIQRDVMDPDAVGVVVIYEDGRVCSVAPDVENDDAFAWWRRRCENFLSQIRKGSDGS